MSGEELAILLMTLLVLAGVAVLWMAMQSRRRIREMEHRERLAMIERGLIPPPELDPGLFERRAGIDASPEPPAAARSRSIGVLLIGLGFGLLIMIAFAADAPSMGIGIGGAVAVLGAAFYVNSVLTRRHDVRPTSSSAGRSTPSERREPPPDITP